MNVHLKEHLRKIMVVLYTFKDDGTDMTIYGEAIGTSRWQKGARLKIEALPMVLVKVVNNTKLLIQQNYLMVK